MSSDVFQYLILEDVTDPGAPGGQQDGLAGSLPPVRTMQDRKGNRYVLLSPATYVRLIGAQTSYLDDRQMGRQP